MRIRKISNLDLIDQYLILSILAIYIIVPILYKIFFSSYLSIEIWIGLIISTFISILMIISKKTPKLEMEKIKNVQKIFSSHTLLYMLCLFFLWELADLIKTINTFDSSINRDSYFYKDTKKEALGGRSLLIFTKMFISSFLLLIYVDILNDARQQKKILIFLMIIIILVQYGQLILTSGSRSPFLYTIIFWVLFYNFYVKEIKISKKNLILFALFVTISFLWLSWSAYFRQGSEIKSGEVNILHGMSGFATAYYIEILKQAVETGKLKFEYGLQMIYNLISWIPRLIWEEKPAVSFSFRISDQLFDGQVGISTWVRTFTIPGEGYLQFGVFGMILWSVIFIYVYRMSKFIILRYPLSSPFFLSLWSAFPILVRSDLSAYISRFFAALIMFFVIFGFLKFLKLTTNLNRSVK